MNLINELVDNFYQHILPITKNISKLLIRLKYSDLIKDYRNIGEKIYQNELQGLNNNDEKTQNNTYEELKTAVARLISGKDKIQYEGLVQ